ncbi:tripartite tricarboxylate transporter permease [Oleispirillum naphthae]|uniref:tripartite tricarboxylate transporter permease n=1 Tax=Oleispirillum naphthae TaxID=2838853 RepID=UPI0030824A8F
MEDWLAGLGLVMQFGVLAAIAAGVILGTFIGAIPGLTATMAIGLLIPFTFTMPPLMGMGLLLGVYVGGYSGGAFSSILLGIPGTPSNFVTMFDGYPMTRKGESGRALTTAVFTSFVGGTVSAVILATVAPPLARLALEFGPSEYFAFSVLGLTLVAGASGGSIAKGVWAACLGILISCIGPDPITSQPRYTFDSIALLRGIPLMPALIGLFALPPLLQEAARYCAETQVFDAGISRMLLRWADIRRIGRTLVSSSLIGTLIGILPGSGAAIACFISYDAAKAISKTPEEFGTGCIEGVAASECCNNATTGGALVPMIVLGIPGDAVTAVLLGGLMIHGLIPGPMFVVDSPDVVYGIFIAFFISNIIMFVFQMATLKYYTKISGIPTKYIVPLLLVFCCLGTYSLSTSLSDVWIMLILGGVGYLLSRVSYPIAPIVLGLVLGPILESNLRMSVLLFHTAPATLLTRPFTMGCLALAAASVLFFVRGKGSARKPRHASAG